MPDKNRTASGVLGGFAGLVGLSAVAGVLIAATVTPAIALSGAAASSAITMFDNLPSSLEIDKLMLPSNFYAKNPDTGEDVLLTQFLEQDRTPVEWAQISPVMFDSILSSEDPRYYEHGGVDLIGTTRAVLSNVQGGGETQGGSTISQQYVKNILVQRCESSAETQEEKVACWEDATTAKGNEGIQRKLQEMRYAIALEQKYTKEEILLGYLNIANFGGITYGIEAAARHYFSVPAAQLNVAQAATLAGMVQNPNSYRIDRPGGSIFSSDGVTTFNKTADGVIDDGANLTVLDSLVESGEITPEQRTAAADGYTSTKVRQLYVLSRLLEDGKITREQYIEAAVWPITPAITDPKTGCAAAGGSAYFCKYVQDVILNDPAFGENEDQRKDLLQRGGLNVYTTLDLRMQSAAEEAIKQYAPSSINMPTSAGYAPGRFGSTTVSVEATTGRILSIAQNTTFSEDAALAADPNYSSLVFAGDMKYGRSTGFEAGSTFKLFTLIDWLEKGHSVNETLNGSLRVFKKMKICDGEWYNTTNTLVNNFNKAPGRVGTPMQFTAASLNTGYFAMAEKLNLCDIGKVATRMGVTQGDGDEVEMDNLNSVIGTNAVSPLAMAEAYATVANNGVYCQPQVIDSVTDRDGNQLPKPERTCSQVIEPRIAATAAFALQSVMRSGGTGIAGKPNDSTPLIGKTGTHEQRQTWLVESSTKVATATWAGNITGGGDVFKTWHNGNKLSDIRYRITKAVQGTANAAYGGDPFAKEDSELTKQVLTDLPDVLGMTVDEAKKTLEGAGFSVQVGAAVDSDRPEGIVAAQNPGAGRVAGGSVVTISPSNGQGIAVPDVSGRPLEDAKRALRSAGFGSVSDGACTVDASAVQPRATASSPAAGSVVNRNTSITVDYASATCGATTGGNGNGNGRGNGGNG